MCIKILNLENKRWTMPGSMCRHKFIWGYILNARQLYTNECKVWIPRTEGFLWIQTHRILVSVLEQRLVNNFNPVNGGCISSEMLVSACKSTQLHHAEVQHRRAQYIIWSHCYSSTPMEWLPSHVSLSTLWAMKCHWQESEIVLVWGTYVT
jgi:hypothetical protein